VSVFSEITLHNSHFTKSSQNYSDYNNNDNSIKRCILAIFTVSLCLSLWDTIQA